MVSLMEVEVSAVLKYSNLLMLVLYSYCAETFLHFILKFDKWLLLKLRHSLLYGNRFLTYS